MKKNSNPNNKNAASTKQISDLNSSNLKVNLNRSQNQSKNSKMQQQQSNQLLNNNSQKIFNSNFKSTSDASLNSSNRPQSTSTLSENKKAAWKLLGSDDDV